MALLQTCLSLLQAPWRNKPATDNQRVYAKRLMKELSDAVGKEALPKDITDGLPKPMSMKDMSGLIAKMKYFPASDGQKEALTVRQGGTREEIWVDSREVHGASEQGQWVGKGQAGLILGGPAGTSFKQGLATARHASGGDGTAGLGCTVG